MIVAGSQETNQRIHRSLNAANAHWSDFQATLQVFQSNIQRRDFAAAEAERPRLEALLENYLDQYMLAGKLVNSLGDPT